MTKFWTNYRSGQRIEASDAIQVAVDSPVQAITALANDVIVGPENQNQSFVLEGFTVTNPSGTIIQIDSGTAILGYRRNGQAGYGLILSGGPSSLQVDVASLALLTTYGIYVRFEFLEEAYANRFFWNPLAVTPAETAQNIPTRLAENWTYAINVSSPGPEWVQIAAFQRDGGGNLVDATGAGAFPTDTRPLLFDYVGALTDSEWGATADRTAPAAGLRQVISGLLRQVQDIIGAVPGDWKATVPANLTSSFLRVDGSNTMNGDLNFDSFGVRDIGDVSEPGRIYSREIHNRNIYGTTVGSTTSARTARFGDNSNASGPRQLIDVLQGYTSGGLTTGAEAIRTYAVGNSPLGSAYDDSLEFAFNCSFNPATGTWTRDASSRDATLIVFAKGQGSGDLVRVLHQPVAGPASFNDSAWIEAGAITGIGRARFSTVDVNGAILDDPRVPIGWGHLITDGAGGLFTNVTEGCTAAISGTGVLVTMPTFSSANDYCVIPSSANVNITMWAGSRTTTTFLIEADDAGGTNFDMSTATGLIVDFVIYGRRP